MNHDKPILGVDVDGVLNAFSPDITSNYGQANGNGYLLNLNFIDHPEWLAELSEHFDLVWATMWCHDANHVIAPLLGIPPMPVIDHDKGDLDGPFQGIDHFKILTIDPYIGDRAFAWIDDDISWIAHEWAAERNGPTKLVAPDPDNGMQREHVDELIAWAKSLSVVNA